MSFLLLVGLILFMGHYVWAIGLLVKIEVLVLLEYKMKLTKTNFPKKERKKEAR